MLYRIWIKAEDGDSQQDYGELSEAISAFNALVQDTLNGGGRRKLYLSLREEGGWTTSLATFEAGHFFNAKVGA